MNETSFFLWKTTSSRAFEFGFSYSSSAPLFGVKKYKFYVKSVLLTFYLILTQFTQIAFEFMIVRNAQTKIISRTRFSLQGRYSRCTSPISCVFKDVIVDLRKSKRHVFIFIGGKTFLGGEILNLRIPVILINFTKNF